MSDEHTHFEAVTYPEAAKAEIERLQAEWERECADTDALLAMMGLTPDDYRTDGGSVNLPKVRDKLNPSIAILPGLGRRSVAAMLSVATRADLTEVVIVGTLDDGTLFVSSSEDSMRDIAWLAARLNVWISERMGAP